MQLTRFKHWRIHNKIMAITVVSIAVLLAGSLFYILPAIEQKIMLEKKNAIRHQVEAVMAVIESYDNMAKSGQMPLEQAQKTAADIISRMRYDTKEYFFIESVQNVIIMHPIKNVKYH